MMHTDFLAETLRLAESAREKGNHPFGALLSKEGKAVLTAENTVITDHDPTCHAELNLVKKACVKFTPEEIGTMTLYTSTEPCAMCSAAMVWAGIRHVVYALPAEKLGELTHASFVVPCREVLEKAKKHIEVEGPFMEKEALEVHEGFWE